MSVVLIEVSGNAAVSYEKLRGGLVTLSYDKDHELCWIEVIDPKNVVSDFVSPTPQTVEEEWQEYWADVQSITTFRPGDMYEVRKAWEEARERMDTITTPEVRQNVDEAYRQKLLNRLQHKFDVERALLSATK